jgi:hypothetical protein
VELCCFALAALLSTSDGAVEGPAPEFGPHFAAQSEKESRTPAQRKINSQLLYEIYRRRGEADQKGVPPGPTGVKIDEAGRALVDVRTEVTPTMERKIRDLGGIVLSTSSHYLSIIARIPILKLERLAEDPSVQSIEPAAEAMTNRSPKEERR